MASSTVVPFSRLRLLLLLLDMMVVIVVVALVLYCSVDGEHPDLVIVEDLKSEI